MQGRSQDKNADDFRKIFHARRDSEAPGTEESMHFCGKCADQILKDDNQAQLLARALCI